MKVAISILGRTLLDMPTPVFFKFLQFAFRISGMLAPRFTGRMAYRLFCTPLIRNTASGKAELDLLSRAETVSIPFKKHHVVAYRWTPEHPRPDNRVVLVLHGWSSYALRFRSFVPELLAQGYAVIGLDAPAHGGSPGRRTQLIDYTAAAVEVCNKLGHPFAIVGHSFGGIAASYLASTALEVESVVAIGTPDRVRDVMRNVSVLLKLSDRVEGFLFDHVESIAGKSIDHYATGIFLKAAGVSTMVVHDINDRVVSIEDARSIAVTAPHVVLHETSGLGHRRILTNPAVVESVVRFLNGEESDQPAPSAPSFAATSTSHEATV